MPTKIEYADESWSPVTGCTKISQGCKHCFAERMARRLAGRYGYPEAPNHFDVTLHPDRLDQPLRWGKPKRIFVCSMSDFFHPAIPLEFQCRMFSIMRRCPQHTFMILTKRADQLDLFHRTCGWPDLPHVWLGVTAENQRTADERIPLLLQTPAVVHYVSVEPMLAPVNLGLAGICPKSWGVGYRPISDLLHWVIVGGESGPGARPMDAGWVRDLRDQCVAADVPLFYKQKLVDGKKVSIPLLDGQIWDQMPTAP